MQNLLQRSWRRRIPEMMRSSRALAMVVATLVVFAVSMTGAGADVPGVYTFTAGQTCLSDGLVSPMGAWDFGVGAPVYLIQTQRFAPGTTAFSLAPSGSATLAPLAPGDLGFGADDLATMSALLSSTRPTDSDELLAAEAVLERSDPADDPHCATTAAVTASLASAGRRAGPLQLSVRSVEAIAVPGVALHVVVTVRNRFGEPAPGVAVDLSGSATAPTSATGTTDDAGQASITTTPQFAGPARQLQLLARATVMTGLSLVGTDSPQGLIAASPVTAQAQTTVPIDESARPVLSAEDEPGAVLVGATLHPATVLSGTRGHQVRVTFTVRGPRRFGAGARCSDLSADAFKQISVATASVATVAGDRPIFAAPVPMRRPGCYLVTAKAQTLDATPAAATSAPPDIITVMDTRAAVDSNDIVSLPGQLRPVVTVSHSYGRLVTVHTLLIGPAQPASGDCAAVDWSTVPRTAVSDVTRTGDGRVVISTQARAGGCYRLTGTATVAVNDADKVELPVVVPAQQMDLILAPQVHDVVAEQVWSLSPAPVPVQVLITGTYGQAGSVRIRMLWTPADPLGCGHANYRAATVVALGEAAEFSGDGVVTATSGATPRLGCYSVVPVVSIRANPAISSSGTPGALGSTVIAGFDLNAVAGPLEPPRHDSVSAAPVLAGLVSFVVLAAASAVVVAYASKDRKAPRPASDGEVIGFPDAD